MSHNAIHNDVEYMGETENYAATAVHQITTSSDDDSFSKFEQLDLSMRELKEFIKQAFYPKSDSSNPNSSNDELVKSLAILNEKEVGQAQSLNGSFLNETTDSIVLVSEEFSILGLKFSDVSEHILSLNEDIHIDFMLFLSKLLSDATDVSFTGQLKGEKQGHFKRYPEFVEQILDVILTIKDASTIDTFHTFIKKTVSNIDSKKLSTTNAISRLNHFTAQWTL